MQLPSSLYPKGIMVTSYTVDDSSNYFDDWVRLRGKWLGIQDYAFVWSKDSDFLMSASTLRNASDRKKFEDNQDYFMECAKVVPTDVAVKTENGSYTFDKPMDHHAVVLFEIESK
jgi:hypothetical protein